MIPLKIVSINNFPIPELDNHNNNQNQCRNSQHNRYNYDNPIGSNDTIRFQVTVLHALVLATAACLTF